MEAGTVVLVAKECLTLGGFLAEPMHSDRNENRMRRSNGLRACRVLKIKLRNVIRVSPDLVFADDL